MKVGVFIAYTGMENGGLFVHSFGVVECLLTDKRFEKIVIFHSDKQRDQLARLLKLDKRVHAVAFKVEEKWSLRTRFKAATFLGDVREILWGRHRTGNLGHWLLKISRFINPYRTLFERADVDVVHVPCQASPVYGISRPMVITMHDLQELHYPHFFSSEERLRRALVYKKSLESSDAVIVTYDHVRKDIVKYFAIPETKVHVCPHAVGNEWFQTDRITEPEVLKAKFNLWDSFLLYPAAAWLHKNHISLFETLKLLNDKGSRFNLVCTGNKDPEFKSLWAEVLRLGLEDQVKFLGIVPEEDLMGLYKSARMVVIPTLYEAGSGPLYEAMRFGTVVICSDVTSLPEAMGNPEFLFRPLDRDHMADLIAKGCHDPGFRDRNLANSRMRMTRFRSMDHGGAFHEAYLHAIEAAGNRKPRRPNNLDDL